MSAIVNLTALAEARAKMTTGAYETEGHDPDGPGGALYVVSATEPALIVAIMPDDERADDDAAGLVAEHNAMPVLLEVARAAIAYLSDGDEGRERRLRQLRGALAKVSL